MRTKRSCVAGSGNPPVLRRARNLTCVHSINARGTGTGPGGGSGESPVLPKTSQCSRHARHAVAAPMALWACRPTGRVRKPGLSLRQHVQPCAIRHVLAAKRSTPVRPWPGARPRLARRLVSVASLWWPPVRTHEHCRQRGALIERIEPVPSDMLFEQQVELARECLAQGRRSTATASPGASLRRQAGRWACSLAASPVPRRLRPPPWRLARTHP